MALTTSATALWRRLILPGIALLSILGAIVLAFMLQRNNTGDTSIPKTVQIILETVRLPQLHGSRLFYLDSSNVLHSVELETKTDHQILELTHSPIELRIAPTGLAALYYAEDINGIFRWFSANLSTHQVTPLHPQVTNPLWSGSGDRILYTFAGTTTELTVAQPNGDDWQALMPLEHPYRFLWWNPQGTYVMGLNLLSSPALELIGISSKTTTRVATGLNEALWSPNGEHALLRMLDDEGESTQLTTLDPSTSNQTVIELPNPARYATWIDDESIAALGLASATSLMIIRTTQPNNATTSSLSIDPRLVQGIIGYHDGVLYLSIGTGVASVTIAP